MSTPIDAKYIHSAAFINRLSAALKTRLNDHSIAVCFSQNKDELVLGLTTITSDFYIIADLQTDTGFLSFPAEFHRARKNSADIFPELIGKHILDVVSHPGERSFHFELEAEMQLVFKMHGRNANLLLVKHNVVLSVFKNSLESDFDFKIPPLNASDLTDVNSIKAIDEANAYFANFSKTYYLQKEKEQIRKYLAEKVKKASNYLAKTELELELFNQRSDFDKMANILMANVHLKIENQNAHPFFDFYTNEEIIIKLKPEISLQKNAENYYRKAKNRKIELTKLQENIDKKKLDFENYNQLIAYIHTIEDVKQLRLFAKTQKINVEASPQAQPAFPFRTFENHGFQIWMGRNAENNDLLTLKYASKDDLWLHAKDVSGSHVVIKHQSGKSFPKNVIETAAEIAAFYSKRKQDSLVPVTVTPKKYVRKPKGFAAGKVIVEREDVVLVQPKEHKN